MRLRRAGGEGGSVGYLRWLAHEHPPAFAGLVGKVLAGKLLGTAKSCEARIGVERFAQTPPTHAGRGVIAFVVFWAVCDRTDRHLGFTRAGAD
jgi:hypothetical protein